MKIVLVLICSMLYFTSSLPPHQNKVLDGSDESQTKNNTTVLARDEKTTGNTTTSGNTTTEAEPTNNRTKRSFWDVDPFSAEEEGLMVNGYEGYDAFPTT